MKVLARNIVTTNSVVERGPQWIFGVLAPQRQIKFPAPLFDRRARGVRALADVVTVAHERVDRTHGIFLFARKQQEGIIEVAGTRSSDAAAKGVGRLQLHRASHKLAANGCRRSHLEMAGRLANT